MESSGSEYGPVADSYEHGNEHYSTMKYEKYLD